MNTDRTNLISVARAREAIMRPQGDNAEAGPATVAPTRGVARSWEGRNRRRPWEYQVTVCVPHLETPETLPPLLELLALQTVRPYVLVIDTGSSAATCEAVEQLRWADVEIHFLRAHGYRHSSAPVTTALDVAHALCRTEYLFHTHSDVFPRRRDLLEWLLGLCDADQPVVGYEMSPRPGTQGWRNVVSHTCTMLHMPTVRRVGATWSFERYWESGEAAPQRHGHPDTEQPFDRCLRRAGVFPFLIGHDANHVRHTDANIDHVRSLSGLRLYDLDSGLKAAAEKNLADALYQARQRAGQWRREITHGGERPDHVGAGGGLVGGGAGERQPDPAGERVHDADGPDHVGV